MTIESSTDRDAMLADFGAAFTKGASSFKGVFDHEYVESFNIDGERPVLRVKSSDITLYAIVRDDTITSPDAVNYTVVGLQPDGTGWTVLILEEQ